MPVEIKELIIRATTTPPADEEDESAPAQPSPEDKDELIQECVRQVLRILQKKEER